MQEKLLEFLKDLTWTKYTLTLVAVISGIALFAVFENRQKVYDRITPHVVTDDMLLEKPSNRGRQIIAELVARHPEIVLVTLIDADPLRNMRRPIYRHFNHSKLEDVIKQQEESGRDGSGPLYTSDESNNRQMLAIMSGEFFCSPVDEGSFAKMFPGVGEIAKYSCRVPLPPAFGKATGWFSIHISKWPPEHGLDQLKFDALSMSLSYFNVEIATRVPTRILENK